MWDLDSDMYTNKLCDWVSPNNIYFFFRHVLFSIYVATVPTKPTCWFSCAQGGGFYLRRRLSDITSVPFVVTVPGTSFDGTYTSLSFFLGNYEEVAREMDVDVNDVSTFFFIVH